MKYILALSIVILFFQSSFTQDFWEQTNGPYRSRVLQMYDIVEYQNDLLFASDANLGLFRSTDGGDKWSLILDGFDYANVFTINISEGIIYIGTANGIFKSAVPGDNWTQVGLTKQVFSIAWNSSGDIFAGTVSGMYRSTDEGNNWTEINSGISSGGRVVRTILSVPNGDIFIGTNDGIYKTTNNGNYWIRYEPIVESVRKITSTSSGYLVACTYSNIGKFYTSSDNGISWVHKWTNDDGLNTLTVNYSNDNIYAGTAYDGIFVSTDLGDSWNKISGGVPNDNAGTVCISAAGYIYDGTWGDGIFRTTNGGNEWEQINRGFSYQAIVRLAVGANDIVYSGTHYGIFRSTDDGSSWYESNTGLLSTDIYSIAINSDGYIFAGQGVYGVARSTNQGISWNDLGLGIDMVLAVSFNADGHIFAGTYSSGIYRSTNNGLSWEQVNNGLTTSYISCIIVDTNQAIYAGTDVGIFKSTTNGSNWELVTAGTTLANVWALTINHLGDFFAGTIGGGIFRSTDGGENWEEKNNGLTNTQVFCIVGNQGNLFAGTLGGGVFKSTDNGDLWVEANEGLLDPGIYSLALNSNDYIFAGTFSRGVYKSVMPVPVELTNYTAVVSGDAVILKWTTATEKNNLGFEIERQDPVTKPASGEWVKIGLVPGNGTSEEIHSYFFEDETIISGHYHYRLKQIDYDGTYKYSNEVEVEVTIPAEFALYQNYPNPFNPTTSIKYEIRNEGLVQLKVYDILGREVVTLVNGYQQSGSHRVEFNGHNLSSGIYFYQLKSGSFTSTKKFILMK